MSETIVIGTLAGPVTAQAYEWTDEGGVTLRIAKADAEKDEAIVKHSQDGVHVNISVGDGIEAEGSRVVLERHIDENGDVIMKLSPVGGVKEDAADTETVNEVPGTDQQTTPEDEEATG